jgi:diguanylate cyclase (GGDEF)-like protein/PAS domain S-box-containing protein
MKLPAKQSVEHAFSTILRYQLMLPVIIAAVMIMIIAGYMTGRLLGRQQQRFNISLSYTTETFLEYSAHELEPIALALSALVDEEAPDTVDVQQWHTYFDTLYLLDPDGMIKMLSPFDERYLYFDMSRQEYYQAIDCDLDVNISNTFSSLRTDSPTVYLSSCTENGDIVVGELNLASLQQTTSIGAQQFPEVVVMVVDQNGTLIAHPDFSKVERRENIKDWEVVRQGFEKPSAISYYWRDGTFWFGSTERVEPVGWLIITEVPFWVVYGPTLGAALLMLTFLLLIFTVAARNFSSRTRRQVVVPLQQLSHLTDALAKGDYGRSDTLPRSIYALEEIEHLTLNFQNMSRSISSREALLRQSEKQYRGLVENSPDAIIVHNQEKIVYINDAARQLYQAEKTEALVGQPFLKIVHAVSQPTVKSRLKTIYNVTKAEVLPIAEQKHIRLNGEIFDAETITSSIFFDGSYQAQTVVRDISQRKNEEERLKYLASHDYLTGLPNRFFFEEVLRRILAKSKRTGQMGAILYLDLDYFKSVNDSYGHAIGDEIIKETALRLRGILRDEDIVARIGGDEFVVLLSEIESVATADQTAQAILLAFSKPFMIHEKLLTVSFSIGISVFPRDGDDAAKLLQFSDSAMYNAKDEGKNRAKFYSREMRQQTEERVEILSYLQYAYQKNEFFLVYQPQYDARTNRCIGVEVLLRWQHPKHNLVNPNRFIHLAEETGLILPIGEWVLKEACAQIKKWENIAPQDFHVAVNLTNLQIKQPNIIEQIEKIIHESEISPSMLSVELVENIVFQNPEQALAQLFRFKALGIKISIDDFGTGYSMLGYLARFPFDHLKIDQRIAPNILSDPKDAAIVSGIIAISQELGINVIAEGIETKAQLDFYRSLGCNYFQGWYFSRDVDAETITKILQDQANA